MVVSAVAVAALTSPAAAQTGSRPTPSPAGPASASTTTTTLDPSIVAIEVDATGAGLLQAARAEVGSAQAAVNSATAARDRARQVAADAAARLFLASHQLESLKAAQRAAVAAMQAAHDRLRDVAVAEYVSGGPGGAVSALLAAETIGDFARRRSVFATVATRRGEALRDYTAARGAADAAAVRSYDEVQALNAAKAAADSSVGPAQAALVAATRTLADRRNLMTVIEDATSIPGTDLPLMLLDAYQRAAVALRGAGCAIGWWVLAGVGKVESDHGRMQHARLTGVGDLVPHIRGIPLDGSQDTQRVSGSGGAIVEAEGPMQFIPSTWAIAGRDGNADRNVDVDNVYDAALGAAVYLCRSSADLSTDPGLTAAYLAYNHSDSYAAEVLAYARAYEAADAAGMIPPLSPVPRYQLAPSPTHL